MAEAAAALDGAGATVNRAAVRNLRLALSPAQVAGLSVPMCPAQTADESLARFGLRMIDVLIDCRMADGHAPLIQPDPAGDLLGGPAQGELGVHIAADRGLL